MSGTEAGGPGPSGRKVPAGWRSPDPRRERAQRLASLLRERIATGELAAGSRLDESALAADCSASRNTVREALGL
ncbi:MAG: GntR family transcriptional regulator, partial [Nocardioidaceae bacterium]|nr:GntR family transcriptional regulator [Nocardioidaceae bacterium]